MQKAVCLVIAAVLISTVSAKWGFTAHGVVSQIAQANLTSRAAAQVNALVGGDLESVCTWADDVRSQSKYAWSAVLHYVNPLSSNYPSRCAFNYATDCAGDNCVIGAIYNYSYQLNGSKPSPSRAEALKFLTHFVQDIHNPVHVFGPPSLSGGNNIDVKFYNSNTNLHSLWDTGIPERTISLLGSEARYLSEINSKINGIWKSSVASWVSCSKVRSAICPDEWAKVIEQINCSNTMVGVYDGVTLGDDYYNKNYEVVEKQLAMAGLRLAAILNEVFP